MTESFAIAPDLIYLPVSLGEAIDKLTILDIKLDKIKDNRRLDVEKEYDLLYEKLNKFLIKYNDLYQSMKKVNLLIWNMMDILRDGEISNEEYLKVCKECVEYNDIRFRVKNKINYAAESLLKEQKSYKVNRLLININNDILDLHEFVRPIKYYSFFYDEIVIMGFNGTLGTLANQGIVTDPESIESSKLLQLAYGTTIHIAPLHPLNILKEEFNYDPTIIFEETLTDNMTYKKQFIFFKDDCEQNRYLDIFQLNNELITKIL